MLSDGQQQAAVHAQTSIGSQLLLLVIVVALPLLGVVFYSTYSAIQSELRQAHTSALGLAQLTATHVEQILIDSEDVLKQLAQRPQVRALDPQQCDSFLEEVALLFPRHLGIRTTNASGEVICATGTKPGAPLPSVADREWFQEISHTQRFTVGAVQQGRITGNWIAVLAYPILQEQGEFAGVIGMPIDLVRFQVVLDTATVVPGTTITILDAQGTVVARSLEAQTWVGREMQGMEIVDRVLAEREGQTRATGMDKVERLYGYTTISRANWYVHSGIPARAALAPVYRRLIEQGLLVLMVIGLVSILAYVLKNQIERPMRALAGVAQEVASGRLDQRAPFTGPKEFIEVAAQFNHMLDVREQHTSQLEYHSRQLETLAQLGQAVTSTLDLPILLNRVVEHVDPLLAAEGISIWIVRENSFHYISGRGLMAAELKGSELPFTDKFVQKVIFGDGIVNIQDTHTEVDSNSFLSHMNTHHHPPIQAIQAAPIALHGTVVGMMISVHSQQGALNEEDLHLLEAVTSWVAISIGNARQHEQARWLAHQVINAQEEERKRLAQELHDEAGQSLTALKFSLSILHNDLPERTDNGSADPSYRERLQTSVGMVDAAMQQLRLLSHGLHPPLLTHFGLNLALEEHCKEFAAHTGLSIDYQGREMSSLPADLPDAVNISFYRLLQEALTNVAKHAEAQEVQVILDFDGEVLSLQVKDNGKGFDLHAIQTSGRPKGIGLLGMQERFRRLGGECIISSKRGEGTLLVARYHVEQEKSFIASTEPVTG
jgi:signal transduction histidine kinase